MDKCIHIAKQPNQKQGDVTPQSTGKTHTLCMDCLEIYQHDPRANPAESEAWNIFRSTDPDLPKDKWTKLNDKPIFRDGKNKMQYRDSTGIPGTRYYFYIVTVNAFGLTSPPSQVIHIDQGDKPFDMDLGEIG
jgi:hypothetical protein